MRDDRDFVALFNGGRLPARFHELARSRHFDGPAFEFTLGVADVEFDPRMRIGPPEFFDDTRQFYFFGPVENRRRMMSERSTSHRGTEQQNEDMSHSYLTSFHLRT